MSFLIFVCIGIRNVCVCRVKMCGLLSLNNVMLHSEYSLKSLDGMSWWCCYCSSSFNMLFIQWKALDFPECVCMLKMVWCTFLANTQNLTRAHWIKTVCAIEIETLSHIFVWMLWLRWAWIEILDDMDERVRRENARERERESKISEANWFWLMVAIYNHVMNETCIQIASFPRDRLLHLDVMPITKYDFSLCVCCSSMIMKCMHILSNICRNWVFAAV